MPYPATVNTTKEYSVNLITTEEKKENKKLKRNDETKKDKIINLLPHIWSRFTFEY